MIRIFGSFKGKNNKNCVPSYSPHKMRIQIYHKKTLCRSINMNQLYDMVHMIWPMWNAFNSSSMSNLEKIVWPYLKLTFTMEFRMKVGIFVGSCFQRVSDSSSSGYLFDLYSCSYTVLRPGFLYYWLGWAQSMLFNGHSKIKSNFFNEHRFI